MDKNNTQNLTSSSGLRVEDIGRWPGTIWREKWDMGVSCRITVTNTQASQDGKVLHIWIPAMWTEDWPGLKAVGQRRPIHLMRFGCISTMKINSRKPHRVKSGGQKRRLQWGAVPLNIYYRKNYPL